ncbi:Gfo/Idh/MocA family protein [Cohnella hashimotonis]|uniref:Gfo/Idh/MocA family oxidoreductase n=1 Tax=Cohnella hashimotonis TaxID=2826895 RepID=A0ABT6TQX1_9BACL|nr:Gfo/Idh/MocA family oxidoreductase [Cohnella hashimotonis]MDI4649124.1 Gfo/Idh/MocA family oxidoreductase [Cohnella hashimotonis]
MNDTRETRALRTAVIGGGAIGLRHLEALAQVEELEACAVVELNEAQRHALAAQFGIRAYASMETMLEAERPALAIVALPHHLHVSAALLCIEYGCHLLLEKPMANTVADCDRIIEAAERRGVQIMVGHTQHYLPENRAAKSWLAGGELGQLVMAHDIRHVNYFREDRPAWFFDREAAGGGIMMNLGAHSIDKLQWLTDSRVLRVKAALTYLGGRGNVEGSGMLMLALSGGFSATIVQSGYAGAARSETELIFAGGMLRIVAGEGVYVSRGGTYEPIEVPASEAPLVLQLRDFCRCLRTGEEPECSGAYSRSVIETLESVYRSHESGAEEAVGGGRA